MDWLAQPAQSELRWGFKGGVPPFRSQSVAINGEEGSAMRVALSRVALSSVALSSVALGKHDSSAGISSPLTARIKKAGSYEAPGCVR